MKPQRIINYEIFRVLRVRGFYVIMFVRRAEQISLQFYVLYINYM